MVYIHGRYLSTCIIYKIIIIEYLGIEYHVYEYLSRYLHKLLTMSMYTTMISYKYLIDITNIPVISTILINNFFTFFEKIYLILLESNEFGRYLKMP